jgi:hypothetical protein
MIQRMEMPAERAMRLMQAVPADQWTRCSPDIVKSFLEHTERRVIVEANGEIKFMHDGRTLIFCHAGNPLAPETKALAYHHPADPQFLHLTTGDGRILGTWSQRGRGNFLDQQAIAEAMRYTHAARESAKSIAGDLAAPQREPLDAMRASNAALQQFVITTDTPATNILLGDSAVAAGLRSVPATADGLKKNPVPLPTANDCTNELLRRAESAPKDEEYYD